MSEIEQMIQNIRIFCQERDWDQFNTPKDMAMCLSAESAEVLELFLWKDKEGLDVYISLHKEEIGDELADVLYSLLKMCDAFGINIVEAHQRKLNKMAEKYPIEKSRGNNKKYTEL